MLNLRVIHEYRPAGAPARVARGQIRGKLQRLRVRLSARGSQHHMRPRLAAGMHPEIVRRCDLERDTFIHCTVRANEHGGAVRGVISPRLWLLMDRASLWPIGCCAQEGIQLTGDLAVGRLGVGGLGHGCEALQVLDPLRYLFTQGWDVRGGITALAVVGEVAVGYLNGAAQTVQGDREAIELELRGARCNGSRGGQNGLAKEPQSFDLGGVGNLARERLLATPLSLKRLNDASHDVGGGTWRASNLDCGTKCRFYRLAHRRECLEGDAVLAREQERAVWRDGDGVPFVEYDMRLVGAPLDSRDQLPHASRDGLPVHATGNGGISASLGPVHNLFGNQRADTRDGVAQDIRGEGPWGAGFGHRGQCLSEIRGFGIGSVLRGRRQVGDVR